VEKREALEAKQRREHSWETAKEIDEVQEEINQVLRGAGFTPPFQT
jgi:hypothetical protein